jgi:hypothetical protein
MQQGKLSRGRGAGGEEEKEFAGTNFVKWYKNKL